MGGPESFSQQVRTPEDLREEIIVEVGCGPRSLLTDAPEDFLKKFRENSNLTYVAVDINKGYVDEAESILPIAIGEQLGSALERVSFKNVSGAALPFSDSTVREVVFQNVFGEPRIPPEDKQAMLREALRVLKHEGTATIVEDITPQVLKRHGVIMYGEQVFGGDPEISVEAKGQGILSGGLHALIGVFKKKTIAP